MTFGTNDLIKRNDTVPEPKLITLSLLDPNEHPYWFKWGNMSFIIQGFIIDKTSIRDKLLSKHCNNIHHYSASFSPIQT